MPRPVHCGQVVSSAQVRSSSNVAIRLSNEYKVEQPVAGTFFGGAVDALRCTTVTSAARCQWCSVGRLLA